MPKKPKEWKDEDLGDVELPGFSLKELDPWAERVKKPPPGIEKWIKPEHATAMLQFVHKLSTEDIRKKLRKGDENARGDEFGLWNTEEAEPEDQLLIEAYNQELKAWERARDRRLQVCHLNVP